jgi:hypothetical protein
MLLSNVVIGSNLESALYAFLNNFYFIPSNSHIPPFYKINTVNFLGNKRSDYSWSRLNLMLSLQGKLLNYENLQFIKVYDNFIKISHGNLKEEYLYENCYIFDTTNVIFDLDVEIEKTLDPIYRVFDDYEISNLGAKHKYIKSKISKNNFAKEIHFYNSTRVDGARYVTDCVVESILSKEQIKEFDYSDTMVRFAVERYLTKIGIFGTKVGIYKSGKKKYRKPKVIHNKRILIKEDQTVYKDTKKIKFLKRKTMKDIIF